MVNLFKKESKIDVLVKQQSKLIVAKQKVQDKQNETNSKIETEIKELENKAFRNKQVADGKIAELDRQIKKGQEQIALEAKYYNTLATDIKIEGQR